MSAVTSFQDLFAWQVSKDLSVMIYQFSLNLPPDERFGLTSQMRRAAVSIPSNIAEGYGRRTPGEYKQFLRVALGSVRELQTQLLLCQRLEIAADPIEPLKLADRVAGLVYKLEGAVRTG